LFILKIYSGCKKVQKYEKGDRLPHWAHLTDDEWGEIMRRGYREHHTLCPECRRIGREG